MHGAFGGSHVMSAYDAVGKHEEWIEHVEGLLASSQGQLLPAELRLDCLFNASDMASRGHLFTKAADLARRALDDLGPPHKDNTAETKQRRVHILGCLLRAHVGLADMERKYAAMVQIEELLAYEEKISQEKEILGTYYNIATRYLCVIEEWESAIRTSRRATELWDFGPNHYFLAAALWAGRRDRAGALAALRNTARDARLSGKGMCRNLRDDFRRDPVFADVRDDPEFLDAIKVAGVVE
jgi:tetratricopeptide (TPR) repeat protein